MGINVKHFEEAVDSQFVCSHCHGVFIDPVLCQCSHILCWSCYKRRKKRNGLCLVCSEELSVCSQPLANEWTRQLAALKVTCTKGCSAVVFLDQLTAHFVKECPYSMTFCSNKGCSKKTRRLDLEDHLQKCDFRMVSCCCGIRTPFVALRTHQMVQKCVLKQNLQTIIKKRREMEHAVRDHRLKMQKKCFEVECERRRMENSKHRLVLSPPRMTTAMSVKSEPTLSTVVEKSSLPRYSSRHSAPAPSQTTSMKTCGQCGKLFSPKGNHEKACIWHLGVGIIRIAIENHVQSQRREFVLMLLH